MNNPGFLFDNDGVLIDSMPLHWLAWQKLMEQCEDLKFTFDQFSNTSGKRNDLILKDLVPHSSCIKREEWARNKEIIFRKLALGHIQLLDGIEAFLQQLKERGIPRIIASSAPLDNLKMFVETTVLKNYFVEYCSAEQVPHGKPFPDVFVKAASMLKLDPEECIVLEDAPAGIRAGQAAGCFVVALGTTHSQEELKLADLFFSSPKALDLDHILAEYERKKRLS